MPEAGYGSMILLLIAPINGGITDPSHLQLPPLFTRFQLANYGQHLTAESPWLEFQRRLLQQAHPE